MMTYIYTDRDIHGQKKKGKTIMTEKVLTTRVLVSKSNLTLNEEGRIARREYPIFQEDTENVVFTVPEEDAEEIARKLNGLIDLSE